ncbi:DUF1707 SHOCT-like domain-containing protein [Blastococcus saxobsidens]|uniref:Putative Translation initiation factor IF-2 n=1 Tax=Blastococcus saxobsidens (strain DD2) TaxID=1146883 RepID=H6RLB0_BLASD|nr:DUF1707 domain-containing protein [Blastococcus saxobsidens]CCG01240.1 putative Translation initiation factor IF-2 [Blastococcus saxobsidens DD2]
MPEDPRDAQVRASDDDREETVRQLQRGLTQGRLTVDEFDERVRAAYAARTLGELAELTRDLPRSLW